MKPEKVIRFGAISASVFLNKIEREGATKELRNVKLLRRYRDSDGQWKTSDSMTLADLPVAIEVLRRTLDYVAGVEATPADA